MEYLGEHTLVPGLTRNSHLCRDTPLEHSGGKLPPYMVVVGDRMRVLRMAPYLDRVVILDALMENRGKNKARVAIAVGTYKDTPIAIVEHSMGCACAEIIVREILHDNCSTRMFHSGHFTFDAPSKYMIRYGSCGATNNPDSKEGPFFNPFDISIASHQVGVSFSDVQAVTGELDLFGSNWQDKTRAKLSEIGYAMVPPPSDPSSHSWPSIDSDPELTAALSAAAQGLLSDDKNKDGREFGRVQMHVSGNVSKDSLYAELEDEAFIRLRREFDVGTTEMEYSALCRVGATYRAHHQPVQVGMVVVVLGVIPGSSFAEDDGTLAKSSRLASLTVLEALHAISLKHRSIRSAM